MSNKLIKDKPEVRQKEKPELQFWISWGKIYISCGICSLLLLGFVSLLPQDYEKYNIPLFFGVWFAISILTILLGAVVILLVKKSKRVQKWAEKEATSYATWRLKQKTNKPLYCVQAEISARIVWFLVGGGFVLVGLIWMITALDQAQLKTIGIIYVIGLNLFFILMGLFLLQKALLRIRVYVDDTVKIRWFFFEKMYRISEIKRVTIKTGYAGMGCTKTYKFYTHSFFPICLLYGSMKNAERLYHSAVSRGAKTQKK